MALPPAAFLDHVVTGDASGDCILLEIALANLAWFLTIAKMQFPTGQGELPLLSYLEPPKMMRPRIPAMPRNQSRIALWGSRPACWAENAVSA